MTRKFILLIAIGVLLLAGAVIALRTTQSGTESADAAAGYVALDGSLEPFVSDFNAAAGSVRLVFVVGPSCGPCLRGLDDMNRVVGDMTRDNPELKAFVLYVPTLGAQEQHAARAVRLMKGRDIRHYWDREGLSGVELQKALGVDAYAWDVWLIYDRDATWSGQNPPAPAYWEHQLGGLPLGSRLNPKRFAAKVAAMVNGAENDD